MPGSSKYPGIVILLLSSIVLPAAWGERASAEDSPNYVLTEDALNRTLGALNDLRSKGLPISVGEGSLESEIANLKKQAKAQKIIKKRGLSLREFVLTYKSAMQIRQAEKSRDNWQKILQDPNATPQAKLEATEKLGESLQTNLFTPEQLELVRRRMPDLESLLPAPK